MHIKYLFQTAVLGLKTHRFRSILTILGIVIGIAAIILIQSVGSGAQRLILNQVQSIGSKTILVEPGKEPSGPSDFAEILTDSLKKRDVEALLKPGNVPGIADLTPEVLQVMPLTYENETIRGSVIGTSPLFTRILNIYPNEGAFFTQQDIREKASVAVIGSEVKEKLFGNSDALGKKIKIKGRTFRVIGVFHKKGQVGIFNIDMVTVIPVSTAQEYLIGSNYYNAILIEAESEEILPSVIQDIEFTIREMHGIDNPDKDDFHVMSQVQTADRVKVITDILTALLVAVASISLVVGGIGIMNIMLVSVTERTREIGLRKAIGATNQDILKQFLFESIALTGLGGILGIIIGALLAFIASWFLTHLVSLSWEYQFPLSAALIGLVVSALVGLVFGIYPARQASLKSPMEALRYE